MQGLTTPSGSTSSRCLGCPPCKPVSTYWPGVVVLSRTRKSPFTFSSFSASLRFIFPWYQGSRRSCSSMEATTWAGGRLTGTAGGTRRASSKGSAGKGAGPSLASHPEQTPTARARPQLPSHLGGWTRRSLEVPSSPYNSDPTHSCRKGPAGRCRWPSRGRQQLTPGAPCPRSARSRRTGHQTGPCGRTRLLQPGISLSLLQRAQKVSGAPACLGPSTSARCWSGSGCRRAGRGQPRPPHYPGQERAASGGRTPHQTSGRWAAERGTR